MKELSDEQRAHDIAIAMLPIICAKKASKEDIMGAYKETYGFNLQYLTDNTLENAELKEPAVQC